MSNYIHQHKTMSKPFSIQPSPKFFHSSKPNSKVISCVGSFPQRSLSLPRQNSRISSLHTPVGLSHLLMKHVPLLRCELLEKLEHFLLRSIRSCNDTWLITSARYKGSIYVLVFCRCFHVIVLLFVLLCMHLNRWFIIVVSCIVWKEVVVKEHWN